MYYTVFVNAIQKEERAVDIEEIIVSNETSRLLYGQIAAQMKTQFMSGELKAGEALPSIRSHAKSMLSSVMTGHMTFCRRIAIWSFISYRIAAMLCQKRDRI